MFKKEKRDELVGSLTETQLQAVKQVINPDIISHSDEEASKALSEEEITKALGSLSEDQVAAVQQILMSDEEDESEEEDEGEEKDSEKSEDDKSEESKDDAKDTKAEPEEGSENNEGSESMAHNIFEANKNGKNDDIVLHSDDVKEIFLDAQDKGSLHDAIIEHGVKDIETLFPEAVNVTPGGIQSLHDQQTSTDAILAGVRKYPKGHIKVRFADLGMTQGEVYENLRAKGYIKGNFKKEQAFNLLSRDTNVTTIYKKQGLDRDDLLDLEDFDLVRFYWQEMRMFLNEEIARAILVGDGRDAVGSDGEPNPDKIDDTKLKPIMTDDDFYTLKRTFKDSNDFIEKVMTIRKDMLGAGNRTLYTSVGLLDDLMLIKDTTGRYIWTEESLKSQMRVAGVVETSFLPEGTAILGNLQDYTVSAPKGGQIFTADDFDIDYNKYKYLIETRVGGMITTPRSFAVFQKEGTSFAPTAPKGDNPKFQPKEASKGEA